MDSLFEKLSCCLISGKYSCFEPVPKIYNSVYRYWHSTWLDVFTRSGSPSSLNVENFLRQDVVVALHQQNVIAGMIGTCFFNLSADATYAHQYLRPFPENLIRPLKESGVGLVTTAEYLAVNPEFRRNVVGIPLSDVLIGLALKVFVECGGKAVLATSVRPARVHESARKFGYSEVGSIEKYGLDCVLLTNSHERLHEHEDSEVQNAVDEFWTRKQDLTERKKFSAGNIIPLRIASKVHRKAA